MSRHVFIFSKSTITKEEGEDAANSILTLINVLEERIEDLKVIWRKQKMDVATQMKYYCNGLLEDYYNVCMLFDADNDI